MKRDRDFVVAFALGCLIGFIGGCGVARGAEVSGPADLQAAYASAVVFWHGEPEDCATVALTREPAGIASEGGGFEAGHAEPPFKVGSPCAIAIAEGVEGCALAETMRHEAGHLRGLGHSADPQSVMYPEGDVDHPLCQAERLAEYEGWLSRERMRCRRVRRSECWSSVRGIRAEVRRRRAALAATPEMLP